MHVIAEVHYVQGTRTSTHACVDGDVCQNAYSSICCMRVCWDATDRALLRAVRFCNWACVIAFAVLKKKSSLNRHDQAHEINFPFVISELHITSEYVVSNKLRVKFPWQNVHAQKNVRQKQVQVVSRVRYTKASL